MHVYMVLLFFKLWSFKIVLFCNFLESSMQLEKVDILF